MKKIVNIFIVVLACLAVCSCSSAAKNTAEAATTTTTATTNTSASDVSNKTEIESALNLANMNAEWTYSDSSDSWTLSIVTAVTNPEIEDEQGVSVCVPGAYVKGVDTNGDGKADATSGTVNGNLVIDY
ncbi:MAG: hypothetical protein K5634_00020, partial [Sphaerochaetaceae bacterium]|nr:hypothetical protein [Sphaerochaetaceae bacterium]